MYLVRIKNLFTDIQIIILVILTAIISFQSCMDLSNDPNKDSDSGKKISVISPVTNGSLQEGNNIIQYSVVQPYSIKFIELYVDDVFIKNIPPNSNGSAPQVSFKVDSSEIGKSISIYLIYYDNDGTSSKSNIVKNILLTGDQRVPFKPYKISLLNFNNGTCNISWKDSSRYVEKYELWRKTEINGTYNLLKELTGNSFNTNDSNLDTNKTYFYKVRGYKNSGYSEFSDEINTDGIIFSGNLIPPTNLTGNTVNGNSVLLNWNDTSENENYFAVERSTNNLLFSRIAGVPANTISYKDSGTGLVVGTTYYYRVKSYSNTDSAVSNTVQIRFSNVVLLAPSNLQASYNSAVKVVELSWTNNDNNTVYIDIERKTQTGQFALLRRVIATTELFLDFNITTNQVYTYRLRGYDLNVYSPYSDPVTVSTY